ncbi:hypothetical protein MTR67_044581 [Solanum verrucosum]|uniref:Gag-pol polyprotein n=1 Tax=Solanum verrucosum TaxID=315347 RepID=A0AAF0ZTR3_SOLVR|nr:hypothetical protein MTR67_044581 [Solanum verrucosum]
MTKADATVSSIPPTIVSSDNFYNDGLPSDPLLDVRVETTIPNNSDVPYEGKVPDVTQRVFSWCSKNQDIVAQSTVKAEFISVTTIVAKQALWLRKVLLDMNFKQAKLTDMFMDDQEVISISNNLAFSWENQAFEYQINILRDAQKEGFVG